MTNLEVRDFEIPRFKISKLNKSNVSIYYEKTLLDEPAGWISPNGNIIISTFHFTWAVDPSWKKQDRSECSR